MQAKYNNHKQQHTAKLTKENAVTFIRKRKQPTEASVGPSSSSARAAVATDNATTSSNTDDIADRKKQATSTNTAYGTAIADPSSSTTTTTALSQLMGLYGDSDSEDEET